MGPLLKASILLFTACLCPLVYLGAKAVDKANIFLMIGLGVSYFAFVVLGYQHVDSKMLSEQNFSVACLPCLLSLPLSATRD
jgi:amino acid permease